MLVLEPRADDVLLWSVATAPRVQGTGLGNRLLSATDVRARELGRSRIRLYTGDRMADNIAWYKRHGYHFLAITDHNTLASGERWLRIPLSGPARDAYTKYRHRSIEFVESRNRRIDRQLIRAEKSAR